MVLYHVHVHNSLTPKHVFKSEWLFSDKEKLFVMVGGEKKGYIINHVTHDLIVKDDGSIEHIVRLNCAEKRIFSN